MGAILVGDGVNAEAGILHNLIPTRQALTVTPEQLVAAPVSWGRILYDNRLIGRMAPRALAHAGA